MIENFEFWALFVTVLGGFFTLIVQNFALKNEICEQKVELTALKTSTHAEFSKCRLHCPAGEVNNG